MHHASMGEGWLRGLSSASSGGVVCNAPCRSRHSAPLVASIGTISPIGNGLQVNCAAVSVSAAAYIFFWHWQRRTSASQCQVRCP